MFGMGDLVSMDNYSIDDPAAAAPYPMAGASDPSAGLDPSAVADPSWAPNEKLKALSRDPTFMSISAAAPRTAAAPAYQMSAPVAHPVQMFQVMQQRRGR